MKCKQFENDIADWLKSRLPGDRASLMEQHAASCSDCSEAVEFERRLMKAWDTVPVTYPIPELWPAIAAKLERPAARPRFGFGMGKFAFAGTLATGALCAVLYARISTQPPVNPGITPSGSASNVLTMVAEMRELPEADPDSLVPGAHKRRELIMGRDDRP